MKDYPNEETLRKAHRIYLDAMRPFIMRCLKKIQGRTLEDLIRDVSDYEPSDDVEAVIDVNNIPLLLKNHWYDIFSKEFDADLNVQSTTWLIKDGRNFWAHPGTEDVDPESTRMHLSLAARVLGEIKNPDAKRAVEAIRDRLFSDEPEEHPLESENAANKEQIADLTAQLTEAKEEKNKCEKRLKEIQDRLKEVETEWIASEEQLTKKSDQLKTLKTKQITAEESHKTMVSEFEALKAEKTALEKVEAEWIACEDRLRSKSKQLSDVKAEKAELEKCLETAEKEKTELQKQFKTMPDPLEVGRIEKAAYEKGRNTASKKLTAAKAVKTELEERLETTLTRLGDVESELVVCEEDLVRTRNQLATAEAAQIKYHEDLAERAKHPPLKDDAPDSVIFQETTFTKHLNKYCAKGRDISQTFWYYWRAQDPRGKQAMRNAGWSVEKVDDNWEVEISPEDFQAWVQTYEIPF